MNRYKLELLPERFVIFRLGPDAPMPSWVAGPFISINRTPDELSIVCSHNKTLESRLLDLGTSFEAGWRCLRVVGPLPFNMIGVIAALSAILADAKISVFVISTFETDYLFVKEHDLAESMNAFISAGHGVAGTA